MLEFLILGPLEVRAGTSVVEINSPLQRTLLIRLILDQGIVVSTDRLIEAVWGDDLPANPVNALRYHIWQLRDALEPNRQDRSEGRFIRTKAPGYYFDPNQTTVDAFEFERLAADGHDILDEYPQRAREVLTTALGLWRGDALADVAYKDFAQNAARRLEERRLVALEDQISASLASGADSNLVPELEQLVSEHPWRERLRGQLMVALYRSGRQVEALGAFREARDLLGEELGIGPSPELRAIERQVLLQEAELDVPRESPVSNLPVTLTSFIGRESELSEITNLIADHRLVTLLGPPGVGKTRLSIEAAARLSAQQRSTWIDLVPVRDREGLIEAVADALGIPQETRPDGSPAVPIQRESTIRDVLRRRPGLLIFDNCEHLIDLMRELAPELLRAAPGTTILATSRRPLGIAAETVLEVGPLEVADAAEGDWEHLLGSEAGRLFVERATAAGATFTGTSTLAAEIGQLCRRLDGLPLALELAASRARSMTPSELLEHLHQRFLLLDGSSDRSAGRGALWNALEWSYDLLTDEEATAFRRISVFVGGFDVEAAGAVIGSEGASALPAYELISRLVDDCLLVPAFEDGTRRFHMLESIRDFARGKLLEHDEAREAEDALCNYLSALAAEAWESRRQPRRRTELWRKLDQIEQEIPTAVNRLLAAGDACRAVTLVGALGSYWASRGTLGRFVDVYRRLGGEGCAQAAPLSIARFTYWWAEAEAEVRNRQLAENLKRRAHELAKSAGDASLAADALIEAREFGALWDAGEEGQWQQALDLYRQAGDRIGEALALHARGLAESASGDFEESRTHLEQAAAILEQEGDSEALGNTLRLLIGVERCSGDLRSARLAVDRGLDLAAQPGVIKNRYLPLGFAMDLAQIEMDEGNPGKAVDLLAKVLITSEEEADTASWINIVRCLLGWALRADGRPKDALDLMITAIRATQRTPWEDREKQGYTSWLIESVAGLCGEAFDPQVAVTLFGAASAIRQRSQQPMPGWDVARYEHDIALVRERLTPEAFRGGWQHGSEMTLDAAINLVFSELSPLLVQD